MMKKLLILIILVFPLCVLSKEASNTSDEQKIKSLVTDFYISSSDKNLNHRYELLSDADKQILNKKKIINIWAHQLTTVALKEIKKVSLRDDFAEVNVEISIKSVINDFTEIKSITLYVKKEQGQWKIAYLYFQPPLFIGY